MGYSQSVFKGFGWLTLAKVVSRGFSFVKVALVARIMGPTEFGLYGVIALVIALFETVTETGINVVLVRKEQSEDMVSTAWMVSLFRGLMIGIFIAIAASPVAHFFANDSLKNYVLAAAFVPFIKGFINPSLAFFQKRLEFHKDTLLRTSVLLIDALTGIVLVLIFRNLWGLVYALLVSAVAEVVLTWIFCSPRPSLKADWSHVKELLHFSKWFNLVVISNYLSSQFDTIVVGRILGMHTLGIYQSAYKVAHAPIVEVADLASQSTFPVYSRMQHDSPRMMRAYVKAGGTSALVTGLLVIGLVLFREQVILLVFGQEWVGAVSLIPVLALAAWIRSLIAPASAVILSMNRPDLLAQVSSIRVLVMGMLALWLMPDAGVMGMAYIILFGNLASVPLLWRSMRIIRKNT